MSSSHDKSLRLWEKTREPLILDEEREMVREATLCEMHAYLMCLSGENVTVSRVTIRHNKNKKTKKG